MYNNPKAQIATKHNLLADMQPQPHTDHNKQKNRKKSCEQTGR